MRRPLFALLALPLLLGADSPGVNPLGSSPEVVAAGRAIYNQSCTVCHGVDGADGDRGPGLAAARRYARQTETEIYDAVLNGVPGTGMPAMGLSSDDAWRITAFLLSLRASAADFPPDGDLERGAALFAGKAGCSGCHRVQGRGGLLGPDLSNLGGSRRVGQIRDALTVAKPHPPAGYRPVRVETRDGRTIEGVLKNEHNFSYQILGADERLHLVAASEIAKLERSPRSLMPSDFDRRLTAEEFRNLVAYLSRLRRR
jgi:cytochrome c oxidase cbb3-type subunit III